jgi:4-amino-4-deoxy-L-arabinose transferase-like glycosyltransferase
MPGMKSLRAAAPWLVVLTVIVRLPGFVWGILNSDDSDFTVIARAIAAGGVPYRDTVDIKPPLTFVLYLPNAWFGGALWPVQVEGALFVVATALVLGVAARRTWGSEPAAVLAAFLSLAAGLCETPTVSTELLMNLPTAVALALHARAEQEGRLSDELYAGLCLGLAALLRHQAIFSLGALGLATIVLSRWRLGPQTPGHHAHRPWFGRCVMLAVGFGIPWAITLGIFQALGALPDFLEWVIFRNLSYVAQNAGSTALRFLQSVGVCLLAAAPLAWWMAITGACAAVGDAFRSSTGTGAASSTPAPEARLRLTWALLLLVSWVPVSLGGRFYEHYFLQFVPAVALLGAGPLEALLAGAGSWSRARRAGFAALALLPGIGSVAYATARGLLGQYPLQNVKVQQIGAWVRENTAPDARIFVWGHFSPIYLVSERMPGTRYQTTSWHLGNFDPHHLDDSIDLRRFRSDRDVRQTLDDLARRRPEWVIDTAPSDIHDWHRLPLSLLPDLEAAIEAGWEPLAASPGGARILRRR